MTDFSRLPLNPQLLQALEVLAFSKMTPVQEHSLPVLLEGKDVIAQARTGSGKTVAFGLAMLSALDVEAGGLQALVLCPTRELADQVTAEVRRLARFIPNVKMVTLCGGVPVRSQAASLARAPHIAVGTPGRILDHLRRENLDLSELRVWVLDEADRMLDMGFAESIADVAEQMPAERQTLLFSATFPNDIQRMSRTLQSDAVEVKVDTEAVVGEIEQTFYECEVGRKIDALTALFAEHQPDSALVFCQTKKDTREVARELKHLGHSVLALHGDMEQRDRDEVLLRFANKSCSILVATDVAARGLDVKSLAAVISYELSNDPDVHLHRIGRTGRAGEKGVALHLVSPRERGRATAIEQRQGGRLTWGRLRRGPEGAEPAPAPMVTLLIGGGRQDKLRAGDLLGALTGDVGVSGDVVGKIDIQQKRTYVAVRRQDAGKVLSGLQSHKIKGRRFRISRVD